MVKILVTSDLHGSSKKFLKIKELEKADYLLSVGDHLLPRQFMDEHFDYYVQGNNDFDGSPEVLDFSIKNLKISMQHGHYVGSYWKLMDCQKLLNHPWKTPADLYLIGHTHFPIICKGKKFLVANPGSINYPRFSSNASYIIITINEEKNDWAIEIKNLGGR